MPPRNAPSRGASRGARGGRAPFAPGNRRGGAGRGSRPGGAPSTAASHVQTIGVRRPNFGTAGRPLLVEVNSFALTTSEHDISHYTVDFVPDPKLSNRTKFKLFHLLQDENPNIFTPKLVYDGQNMAYSTHVLDLGPENSGRFQVSFEQPAAAGPGGGSRRQPTVYNIALVKVATIGTEIIRRYINGQQSWDDKVSNAIMAYNIAIRTQPNRSSPYRGRSFYIDSDRQTIGGGFEVWRGIFQSVRPAIGRLIINIDLTATIMYREGPLVHLVNEFLRRPTTMSPIYLNPQHRDFPSRAEISHLRMFMTNLRIICRSTGSRPRVIRGLTDGTAITSEFPNRDGVMQTVAEYFNSLTFQLQYPTIICVKTGSGAILPLEHCTVLRGQFYNRAVDVPDTQISQVLSFATKKPVERLESIKRGIEKLQFNQSNYIAQFGLAIDSQPIQVKARVIDPPTLKYSGQGRQAVQTPRNGAWNMLDKKFINPEKIRGVWAVAIFENVRRFNNQALQELVKSFNGTCSSVGIIIEDPNPFVKYITNPQASVEKQLRALGQECKKERKVTPTLLVAILPDGAGDIYKDVKHFGDIMIGIPTQCLKASKCMRAKSQYWNNVMLKVNVKLGGINAVPQSSAMEYITDPQNPTVVIGADVLHPGREDKPSIAAVSGSVDSNASKYVAMSCVQKSREETIMDLKEMCKFVLKYYKDYHEQVEKKSTATSSPKRLLFYRDGVSEQQFAHVLKKELPLIREACEELEMTPKITLIVVGKRHHNQMFPLNNRDNTNAPAGTVIDNTIMHPTEFDFLLQSHAGILGTSRPAHYSVLLDETGFSADSLQSLSYALCHTYARSTRAVSIPAPVYYADRVCNRFKIQFGSDGIPVGVPGAAGKLPEADVEACKKAYKPLHQNIRKLMYFM